DGNRGNYRADVPRWSQESRPDDRRRGPPDRAEEGRRTRRPVSWQLLGKRREIADRVAWGCSFWCDRVDAVATCAYEFHCKTFSSCPAVCSRSSWACWRWKLASR